VNLERNPVRFIENFSTGSRGALLAENLLSLGHRVLFVCRDSSRRPFLARAAGGEIFDEDMAVRPEVVEAEKRRRAALRSGQLVEVPFVTVGEYLCAVTECVSLLSGLREALTVILAAAVSDFFIPTSKMSEHKIQSGQGGRGLDLHLEGVPKAVPLWIAAAPGSRFITFKLETDDTILVAKATAALDGYGHYAVVANTLAKRSQQLLVITRDKRQRLFADEGEEGLETQLINWLVNEK
jgi:phosphopantothenate-cysteine ligase